MALPIGRNEVELTDSPLRVLCIGMGAIGTYIGGSLAAAGCQVAFTERPETIERIKNKGLKIQTPEHLLQVGQIKLYPSLTEALAVGRYDVALLAVKSFDTPAVLEEIKPFARDFPTVLCLQNGVENEPLIASVLGEERVIGASIGTAVGKIGPGDVRVEKMRGIGIQSTHSLSTRLIEVFNQAGLNARGYPRRADLKWSKMLSNLLGNATSAILNWTPAQIFTDPRLYAVEVAQVRETLAVMRAQQIRLVNLPGTPIALLIQVMDKFPAFLSRPISFKAMGKGRGQKMPSFHIDLYNGQSRSEVSYLNGAIVRQGEKWGIPTPVNHVLTSTLEKLASGEWKKEEFVDHPEKIIQLIEAEK